MLGIFKKKIKEVDLMAPVDGETVELSKVPDKVFASGMMGDGIAFNYKGNVVTAPCDGEITTIPDSLHAFGITAENGAEILVHIGMDTVNLQGKGFQKLVNVGDKVKMGAPIIKFNRSDIEAAGYNLITPLLVTNSKDYDVEVIDNGDVKAGDTIVLTVKK